ncbi:MAG: hypothetical protein JWR42_1660 [Marmoricola sp.]|nr:hypothetical protein [Marmoricola sp.]
MLRQSGAVMVPLAVWLVGAACVVDAVVEGSPAYAVRTVVVVAAVSYLAWVGLFSPRLEVGPDAARVVNPLRVHEVPYAALEDVEVRGLVVLSYRGQGEELRRVTSWNAPGLPRRRPARGAVPRGRSAAPGPVEQSPSTVTLERFRDAWARAGGAVRDVGRTGAVSWRTREAAVLLGLVGLAFVIGLLP